VAEIIGHQHHEVILETLDERRVIFGLSLAHTSSSNSSTVRNKCHTLRRVRLASTSSSCHALGAVGMNSCRPLGSRG
jgi:hypothetical protein